MNQKGISPILIILIIVGVLVIGGLFWYYQKTLQIISEPAPQVTPADETADFTPSEVEGWQTYRNEEYGFEMKYPENWYAYEDTLGSSIVISTFTKDKYDKYYGTFEHTKLGNNSGTIIIMRDSSSLSTEDRIESFRKNVERSCQVGIKCGEFVAEGKNINGQKSYRMYLPYSERQIHYQEGVLITYLVSNSDKSRLVFSGDFGGKNKEIYEKYSEKFDQILSTFKFIK